MLDLVSTSELYPLLIAKLYELSSTPSPFFIFSPPLLDTIIEFPILKTLEAPSRDFGATSGYVSFGEY